MEDIRELTRLIEEKFKLMKQIEELIGKGKEKRIERKVLEEELKNVKKTLSYQVIRSRENKKRY